MRIYRLWRDDTRYAEDGGRASSCCCYVQSCDEHLSSDSLERSICTIFALGAQLLLFHLEARPAKLLKPSFTAFPITSILLVFIPPKPPRIIK